MLSVFAFIRATRKTLEKVGRGRRKAGARLSSALRQAGAERILRQASSRPARAWDALKRFLAKWTPSLKFNNLLNGSE